jgi:hypothetical protein
MVILTVALHKPKGSQEEANFLRALEDYGNLQRKFKGHQLYTVGKDENTGVLTVVSIWATLEDLMAARGEMAKHKGTFDFKTNQDGPTRYWQGNAEFVEYPLK